MIRAAALAAVLVLAGCEPMTPEQAKARAKSRPFSDVEVHHDDMRAVTCWKAHDPRGGISCLPDWMLTRQPDPIGLERRP